jgi:hypothetical protein
MVGRSHSSQSEGFADEARGLEAGSLADEEGEQLLLGSEGSADDDGNGGEQQDQERGIRSPDGGCQVVPAAGGLQCEIAEALAAAEAAGDAAVLNGRGAAKAAAAAH